ncbi:kinase domain containing protein [Venturia nashicola]|uniref:Kinase domain containing protein n=1 Tax=Venturia nashicola TaxID=86259 RepID=A0A4Z1P251_9PEZI|nr:kinase domain containing protein [Venturia nashicola]
MKDIYLQGTHGVATAANPTAGAIPCDQSQLREHIRLNGRRLCEIRTIHSDHQNKKSLCGQMTYLTPSGERVDFDSFLARGLSGIVLRYPDGNVLKIPKVADTSTLPTKQRKDQDYVNDCNRQTLEFEKAIYRRLGPYDGIAKVINISMDGILLEYYPDGDLEDYISTHTEPDTHRKASWILSITRTICHIHKMKVLVDDIALRNLLVAPDKSLKLVDFGESALFPEATDMAMANSNGSTVSVDIFHLGSVIYSIAAWTKFEYTLFFDNFHWPAIEDLPVLDRMLFHHVIQKCWAGQYCTSDELYADILEATMHATAARSEICQQRKGPSDCLITGFVGCPFELRGLCNVTVQQDSADSAQRRYASYGCSMAMDL